MADDRPKRLCDSCLQFDDHPRHVHGTAGGSASTDPEVVARALEGVKTDDDRAALFAHMRDDTTVMKHMDCCSADGCPDGTCDEVIRAAGNKKGNALVKHLVKEG